MTRTITTSSVPPSSRGSSNNKRRLSWYVLGIVFLLLTWLVTFASQWWTQHQYLMTVLILFQQQQQRMFYDNHQATPMDANHMIIIMDIDKNSTDMSRHPATTTRIPTTKIPTTTTINSSSSNNNINNNNVNISFHRWSSPTDGIDIEALWHCMRGMLSPDAPYDRYGPFPAWIDNQQQHRPSQNQTNRTDDIHHQQHRQTRHTPPPVLLMVSRHVYKRRRSTITRRANILLTFLQDALQSFSSSSSETRRQQQHQMGTISSSRSSSNNFLRSQDFPFLLRALQEPHGIPLLFDVGDYVGCLKDNYNVTRSYSSNDSSATTSITSITAATTVPFFTMSSSPTCGYAFPIPSYATLELARQHPPSTTASNNSNDNDNNHWDEVLARREREYPWHTKIPKAVWRGAISGRGDIRRSPVEIPRIHLNVLAKNRSDILDVAVACAKNCGLHKSWHGWITHGNFTPMESFQRYRAVIDLDGNSWSERFPKLLCQNSVVVKVEPEQIDYFAPTLQAGVHYVAAPANLTHLIAVVEYVVSDEHQEEMQQIVRNANEWCRQRMVIGQLQWDALSVLNGYAEELYKGDPNWSRYSSMDLQDFGFRYLNQSMD